MAWDPLSNPVFLSTLSAFVAALAFGLVLLKMRRMITPLTKARNDHLAVQASHTGDPLRLGGLAAIIGLLVGISVHFGHLESRYTLLLLVSLLPVFAAGLWEDLGHGVAAKGRFLAALMSAGAAVALLGFWVWRGDMMFLDAVMGFLPTGILVTMFIAAVYCHAVNLIDGMNGLAATVVILSAIGFAHIAYDAGLPHIADIALLIGAATLGFQVLNWPVAKLFLGDAGAYGLGHLLVWVGISILALAEAVAVPAVLLILFYPLIDTAHSVFRRVREGRPITSPDRMHLHQKVRRGLEIVWVGRGRRHVSNPLTTVVLLPLIAAPVVAGVQLWDQPIAAWITLLAFSFAFAACHLAIMFFAKSLRKSTAESEPPLSKAA